MLLRFEPDLEPDGVQVDLRCARSRRVSPDRIVLERPGDRLERLDRVADRFVTAHLR